MKIHTQSNPSNPFTPRRSGPITEKSVYGERSGDGVEIGS